jgi:hypothetical protein
MTHDYLNPKVWLTLNTFPDGSKAGVEIRWNEAMGLDRKGFARLYRKHVLGASKREANQWADRQIDARAQGRLGAG